MRKAHHKEQIEEEHWSKLLESVVINTTDGVLITDASFNPGPNIIYVNDALVRMSGYSRQELIGVEPSIFHGHDLLQEGLQKIEHALKHKLPCNLELVNYTKNGKPYDVSINICPVTDHTGTVTHWVSIQRDITENRNYIKEIEGKNKKLTDIAWMHSHQVRAPLSRIMSLVDLLKNHCSDMDQDVLHEYLSKSAAELDDVISNITNNAGKIGFAMNERRFYAFMDELPGLCWITDDQNVLRYANKCFFDTLHLPMDVVGRKLEEIFGQDIARNAHKNNHDVLQSGENKEFHQMLRDHDGHPQHYKTYKFPFQDAEGEGNLVGAVAFNVTKRVKLEEELYQSEAQFKQAFEHSLIGMALISPEGRWEKVNKSLCQILGYTEAEMKALTIQDITYPEDLKGSLAVLNDLAKGEIEEVKYEKRYVHKNGSAIWVVIAATMLYDSNGQPLHYVSQIEDITTRKFHENALQALNTELTASNEQKNKLFSIIGHDLRNPISGSLQLLDMTLKDFESSSADEVHTYLSMMKTELSNANVLLEDLLTWAKSQFDAVSFNPVEIINLAGLVDKCIQTVSPMAVKKNIEIIPSLTGELFFHADIGMLETIIRNLLSNAVKFTNIGGLVIIRARGNDNGILFSVKDNGLGIPKDKIAELFNKNSNYTTYGTLGEKGTGLGLSLCYDFVAKHGGTLWAESEEGAGTTFYFTIPSEK